MYCCDSQAPDLSRRNSLDKATSNILAISRRVQVAWCTIHTSHRLCDGQAVAFHAWLRMGFKNRISCKIKGNYMIEHFKEIFCLNFWYTGASRRFMMPCALSRFAEWGRWSHREQVTAYTTVTHWHDLGGKALPWKDEENMQEMEFKYGNHKVDSLAIMTTYPLAMRTVNCYWEWFQTRMQVWVERPA